MASRASMSDEDLVAILDSRIEQSGAWVDDSLTKTRAEAIDRYNGAPYGDEAKGASSVVARVVAEQIDGMMPDLIDVFCSGDEIVRYQPEKPGDEEAAEQATDYANWIVYQDNPGYSIIYDWFKDALLSKVSIVKVWWEDQAGEKVERYEGLTVEEVQKLAMDPGVEIEEVAVSEDGQGIDCKVRVLPTGKVCIEGVPPEEFLIDRLAKGIASDRNVFCAHKTQMTRSALIKMGFDRAKVMDLPSAASPIADSEIKRARFADDEEALSDAATNLDPSMEVVDTVECYVHVDFDGDDVAELRKVMLAGAGGYTVLSNEEIDDNPFAALPYKPFPHKFFGNSAVDEVEDIQRWQTILHRGALDNLNAVNKPRTIVEKGSNTNLDDLLSIRANGIVRTERATGIVPLAVPAVGSQVMPMIEYGDVVAERRTGQSRDSQGLDPDVLSKNGTATAAKIMSTRGRRRIELVARTFAETGMQRLFVLIARLISRYQKRPRLIRLRDKWVAMDPRGWAEFDCKVSVGLGTGDRSAESAQMMQLIGLDAQIIQMQGGLDGPFVTAENVYAKLRRLGETMRLRPVERYYTDPSEQQAKPPQQPKPDPAMAKVQGELEIKKAELQMQQQAEAAKVQMQAQADQAKAAAQAQTDRERAQADVMLMRERAADEMALARWKAEQEFQLRREEMAGEFALKQAQIAQAGQQQAETEIRRPQ